MDSIPTSIFSTLDLVRKTKPIVHNITNYVAMDVVANGLLALCASPMMAFAEAELEEIIQISSSISLNIGTLDSQFVSRTRMALRFAGQAGKPCVLDPVGCGASRLRTLTTRELLETRSIQIVRGNGSEIQAISGELQTTLGVDSTRASTEVAETAKDLATRYSTVVVVSGQTDTPSWLR